MIITLLRLSREYKLVIIISNAGTICTITAGINLTIKYKYYINPLVNKNQEGTNQVIIRYIFAIAYFALSLVLECRKLC